MRNFFGYVRAAFFYHWNLLALAASSSLAILSGQPGTFLPLVAAGELIYLAVLASNPRYQKAVDALELRSDGGQLSRPMATTAGQILGEIHERDRRNYGQLLALCREWQRTESGDGLGLLQPQLENLNRLLWIYLKLLYSKKTLETFFRTTSAQEIDASIAAANHKLAELHTKTGDSPALQKQRESLTDTIQTLDRRKENYRKAKENEEFILVEIDRLRAKIAAIAESGISHQDPHSLSDEIDVVSSSVTQTEQTMSDLQYLTGLSFSEELIPALLDQKSAEGMG